MTSIELDSLAGAVDILLSRFTRDMDDPALPAMLRGYQEALSAETAERARISARFTEKAKAS